MTSVIRANRCFVVALSFLAFSWGAIAASNTLSFTAHSLNLNPGDSAGWLALDAQGNAYEAGSVTDSSGRNWVQVTKTDPLGQLAASYRFGSQELVSAIRVDQQGSVIVVGQGEAADFPAAVSYGPTTTYTVAFVVKLDSGLTGITASAVIGGNQAPPDEHPYTAAGSVDVDAAGNIYIGGGTTTLDFPVTAGAYETTPSLAGGVLVEFSSGLDRIVFATYSDVSLGLLHVDASGAIVGAGIHGPYAVPSATTPESATATEIVKFAPGGGSVLWTATLAPPGEGFENAVGLALDGGDVVVVGGSLNGSSASAGALQSCEASYYSGGFIAKLSGSSGAIQFLTYFGCYTTGAYPSVKSVAVDASGTIWITGLADPSTLPITPSAPSGSSYVAALAPDGSSVLALYTAFAAFDTTVGGSVGMFGQAVALTSAGSPVVLGGSGFLMLSNTAGGPSLLGGVANSAGSAASGLIAPAELVSFYGTGLGPAAPLNAQVVGGVVQSTLGGYQLLFGGVAAPLLYISANQINAIVPNEVSGQDSVSVTLVTPTGSFPLADLYIRPSQPEIFHDPVSGYAAAINQDGTFNSAANPAQAGEIVSIWGTGSGAPGNIAFPPDGTIVPVSGSVLSYPALPVSMIAGSDSLEVDYAGDSPGEVFGLMQVNFRLPESFASGATSLPVRLQVGGAISATVPIYVAP